MSVPFKAGVTRGNTCAWISRPARNVRGKRMVNLLRLISTHETTVCLELAMRVLNCEVTPLPVIELDVLAPTLYISVRPALDSYTLCS